MNESPSEFDSMEEAAESFLERYRRGERPSLSEYTARYPQLAERIRALFPALVVMEQGGSVGGKPGPLPGSAAAGQAKVPPQLGEYRILREVGRGGMGIVFEAVQESLGRHVALKVLPLHAALAPTHLERFRREAQAAAQLHHTNIVPVFGVGEHDGRGGLATESHQPGSLGPGLRPVHPGHELSPLGRGRAGARLLHLAVRGSEAQKGVPPEQLEELGAFRAEAEAVLGLQTPRAPAEKETSQKPK
jgi:hypothetical protein